MDFAALGNKAAAVAPQGLAGTTAVLGRVLLVDGDALAYFCAGNDDTSITQARINLHERIRTAIAASAAERVEILVTASGSPKGDRYAVASVQPYQGNRGHGQRPKNWAYLRQMLNALNLLVGDLTIPIRTSLDLEADDLFAHRSIQYGAENIVILTQDKDIRMVPGWHLNWNDWSMFFLEPGTWYAEFNDKVFGRAWFWYQMMHGDKADNIPGLPWYKDGSIVKSGPNKGKEKIIKVGDKWEHLAAIKDLGSDRSAAQWAYGFYKMCYEKPLDTMLAMAEQGVLLWMRSVPDWRSVFAPGNPLYALALSPVGDTAIRLLQKRIIEARNYAPTEDN